MAKDTASCDTPPRGGPDWDDLVRRLHACGFDAHAYLARNQDLQRTLPDASAALAHFLEHGYGEERDIVCAALPSGMNDLAAGADRTGDHAIRLFRTIFIAQMKNPETEGRLWRGVGSEFFAAAAGLGGLPYFVIGDSHANHYFRPVWAGAQWFMPLVLVCHGASAHGLARQDNGQTYGEKVLRWARGPAQETDAPVFLKFGGIDAEFRWIRQRLERNVSAFSRAEFERHAKASVARYADFLARLQHEIPRSRLLVCSVFPSVLPDNDWIAGFVRAHRVGPEPDRALAERLQQMEIPGLRVRTALRAQYNEYLREMCAGHGLTYVDDFTPCLSSDPMVDRGVQAHQDHHLDRGAIEDGIVDIIRAHVRIAESMTGPN